MVPLDGPSSSRGSNSPEPASASPSAPTPARSTADATHPAHVTSPSTPGQGTTAPQQPSPTPTPSHTKASTPADLTWSDPTREPTDQRWCEKVTVALDNSGGTAVRSGTVTFGTHIIGALGIDWGTVDSTAGLPAPIAPGAHENPTWTVCVDAWRVPLGMHIETRDVSVRWSQ
ncbi:hypothetical protein Scel_48690 [Streptomyces cellostaticus]|nr:hypothetical protein Scel_48690 [Streptomyces cellostaticus]